MLFKYCNMLLFFSTLEHYMGYVLIRNEMHCKIIFKIKISNRACREQERKGK